MESTKRSLTIGARVNEAQMTHIDAAACLTREGRAHFVARVTLREAERVLRSAVDEPLADQPSAPAGAVR